MYKTSQSYKAQHSVKRSTFSAGSTKRLASYSKAVHSGLSNSKVHHTTKDHTSAINQSSLIEFEEEEYVPCIKLYPVQCNHPKTDSEQKLTETAPCQSNQSNSVSPVKKKRTAAEDEKRKSLDLNSKSPNQLDKLNLKTLSGLSQKKQSTKTTQNLKPTRSNSKVTQQNTTQAQTLYTKVLKKINKKPPSAAPKKSTKVSASKADKSLTETTANDLQETTILDTSVADERVNQSYLAYSSVSMIDEKRPKSSLDGRIGHNGYSSLPREQKTKPSKELLTGVSYEKLFKIRGSNRSSQDFSRQSTGTTKDATPTNSRSREISMKTMPDDPKARKSSNPLRFSYDNTDIKRLNEVQNTRLDEFYSNPNIKVPQGIKVVKSLDLDQSRELIAPNKGFLSKINSSNYHVAKDVKGMVQKSPFKNDVKFINLKKQQVGKTETVSINLSRSLVSLKKL